MSSSKNAPTTPPHSTPPRAGQPLPAFALPDTAGGITRLLDYRQRQPVLVALLHGAACAECRTWLAALGRKRAWLDELNVAVLPILSSPVSELRQFALELDLPFALLADELGSVAERYGLVAGERPDHHQVGIVAANRYGYLLEGWTAGEADSLPPPDAALDQIAFAALEDCGCGLPAWPPELMDNE